MARRKRRSRGRRPRKDKGIPNANNEIRAKKVRVVKPGEGHEIVDIDEAIDMAEARGLDLVEVAPNAKPPVCKVMDLGKYMYDKKKREKEAKKKQHTVQLKELRFRPNTAEHDLAFKTRHARKFLENGNKVKAMVQFRGRDMLYTDRGKELLLDLAEELSDISEIESRPKMEHRRMYMTLQPTGKN